MQTPTFSHNLDAKKIYVESKEEEGKKFPVNIINNHLIITTAYGIKVSFSKSNRGRMFHDSRQRKPITEHEFVEEVNRLLDDKETARQALSLMGIFR